MQTRVIERGIVLYKFYSKPMNNNIVIENGTALPRNIVFGSLRQEIVRRLQNTCSEIDQHEKVMIIEDMIQLMVNSRHRFSFIKSVVLQGLTKFKHMERRAALHDEHPEYKPMHREFYYKRNERILLKYVDKTTWFKTENLGDPFKNKWRRMIKYRWSSKVDNKRSERMKTQLVDKEKFTEIPVPSAHTDDRVGDGSHRVEQGQDIVGVELDKTIERSDVRMSELTNGQGNGKSNITTTFFVPSSIGSLLFKLIVEKEHRLNKQFDWSVKILEQAGVPLLNKFSYKFPIQDGCPRNESCSLCSNDTLKCSTKGIIYRAYCVDCQINITGDKGYVIDSNIPTYIGESSRPARERISEHVKYLKNWNKDSVIIYHWMENHGTEVFSPKFQI